MDDEDENAALEDDVAEEAEEPMDQDGDQGKVKKSISYEEYKKMSFLIIKHIREKEEQSEAGSETPGIIKPVQCLESISFSGRVRILPHPGSNVSFYTDILNKL